MRDDLIGFVIGALDEAEHQLLCRKLEQDEQLRVELRQVERRLRLLQVARAEVPPPEGLAERTTRRLNQLFDGGFSAAHEPESELVDSPGFDSESFHPEAHILSNTVGPDAGVGNEESPHAVVPAWVHKNVPAPGGFGRNHVGAGAPVDQWKFADFAVTAGICLAVACIFFPALLNSRYHAEVAGCQNNMWQLGQGLTMFSEEHNGHFPKVPGYGNAAVAGVYAVKLAHQGLLEDPQYLQCPGKNRTLVVSIPNWDDLLAAKGPELTLMHVGMGGDYAYNLGYLDRGRLQGVRKVRNRNSEHAPLLADAPLENARNVSISSHGRGQNVLFQDGHVRYLTTRVRPGRVKDDVFFNDDGLIRAGMHVEDYVLGASYVSPLANRNQ